MHTSDITVMLVQSDRALAKTHERLLEGHGISTMLFDLTSTAFNVGLIHRPDLVLCGMRAAPWGGVAFCEQWQRRSKSPVVVVAEHFESKDHDAARQAGAVDYLCASVTPDEFVARVRSALPRNDRNGPELLSIGDIQVDTAACDVRCAGKTIRPTATEFRILEGLARSPGRVFSRDRIARLTGSSYFDATDRVIDAHIKNIRRKLGDYAPKLQTVRGFGYRMSDRAEDAGV